MNYGLKKTKYDPRDYSHKKTFGSVGMILPDEYIVGTTPVLNQYESLFCTAFASCVLTALEDNKEFSPEWFFSKEAQISGSTDGQDLRTACKMALKGFLPQENAPYSLLNQTPDFLADNKNWPAESDVLALPYKRPAYFRVDGDFDEIKQTIYQNKKAVLTGVTWYQEWEYSNGIVPSVYNTVGGMHAIPIIGWKTIDGVCYLIIQNSYGTSVGDKGWFYFNKGIFNREFSEPMYMFTDIGENPPKPIGNGLSILINKLLSLWHN